ncbi:MAG: class IV adenylate cyclase [Ignavibacteria bacterium]
MFDKNYEIKCKIPDIAKFRKIFKNESSYLYSKELQTDIYYKVKKGRLKLRIIKNEYANLIFYERSDKTKIRTSSYIISRTNDFKQLDNILRSQFKVLTVVSKVRNIYIKENVRIHLDRLKKLGDFLEIEIIYKDIKSAKKQMKELIEFLELNKNEFIKHSYSDMLIK